MRNQNITNQAFSLDILKQYCQDCIREIVVDYDHFEAFHKASGLTDIHIRYILDEGIFGYARMGDFFFLDDCMYVISDDEKLSEINNPDMSDIVKELLDLEWQRKEKYVARVIFAGIRTPYTDDQGDYIYTGDVVRAIWAMPENLQIISQGFKSHARALPDAHVDKEGIIAGIAAMPWLDDCRQNGEPPVYALMLDNHCIRLSWCIKIERIGTVFYQIAQTETELVPEQLVGRHTMFGFSSEELLMSRYTPSFNQEIWKYSGLEVLGIEYEWRR